MVKLIQRTFKKIFWPCGMWDFSSQPGIQSMPPALAAQSLKHWITGKVPKEHFEKFCFFLIED